MKTLRMFFWIFAICLICLPARAQITVLGKNTNDEVLLKFLSQNNNAQTILQGLSLYFGTNGLSVPNNGGVFPRQARLGPVTNNATDVEYFPSPNVTVTVRTMTLPVPAEVWITEVNLTNNTVLYFTPGIGGAGSTNEVNKDTTLHFMQTNNAVVGMNGMFFNYTTSSSFANVVGFAAYRGTLTSPFTSQPPEDALQVYPNQGYAIVNDCPAFNFGPNNVASLVTRGSTDSTIAQGTQIWNAYSGSALIVSNDVNVVPYYSGAGALLTIESGYSDGNSWYNLVVPRTAMAINQSGTRLYLFCADLVGGTALTVNQLVNYVILDTTNLFPTAGDQPYYALNMDGGDSSTFSWVNPFTQVSEILNPRGLSIGRSNATSIAVGYSTPVAPVANEIYRTSSNNLDYLSGTNLQRIVTTDTNNVLTSREASLFVVNSNLLNASVKQVTAANMQSPWVENINGASFLLSNIMSLIVGGAGNNVSNVLSTNGSQVISNNVVVYSDLNGILQIISGRTTTNFTVGGTNYGRDAWFTNSLTAAAGNFFVDASGNLAAGSVVDNNLSTLKLVMSSAGLALESVTLGSGLSLIGTTLSATGGAGSGIPLQGGQGSNNILYNLTSTNLTLYGSLEMWNSIGTINTLAVDNTGNVTFYGNVDGSITGSVWATLHEITTGQFDGTETFGGTAGHYSSSFDPNGVLTLWSMTNSTFHWGIDSNGIATFKTIIGASSSSTNTINGASNALTIPYAGGTSNTPFCYNVYTPTPSNYQADFVAGPIFLAANTSSQNIVLTNPWPYIPLAGTNESVAVEFSLLYESAGSGGAGAYTSPVTAVFTNNATVQGSYAIPGSSQGTFSVHPNMTNIAGATGWALGLTNGYSQVARVSIRGHIIAQ